VGYSLATCPWQVARGSIGRHLNYILVWILGLRAVRMKIDHVKDREND
jgi:hypothetical protein